MTRTNDRPGWSVFLTIWAGQLVSLLGSGLSGFALGLWVLQGAGSVTAFALIATCTVLPKILLSPLAGAMADRWDRRTTLLGSELIAAAATLCMAVLLTAGKLEVWHIYVAMSLISTCTAFQWPAYSASITMLVSKERLGHASGMVQIAQGLAQTLAPAMAGAMMVSPIGIRGILILDFCTYLFAIGTLVAVRIPSPPRGLLEGASASVGRDIAFGWRYLTERPGLIGLLVMLAACNFLLGAVMILVNPLVLSFASPAVLGAVMTTAGFGMFVGSAAMSVWGGPKRRVRGIVLFLSLGGAALLPAALPPSAMLIACGAFLFLLGIPIASGCTQAILQTKVDPAVQGRVFAFTGMLVGAAMPAAYLVSGPIADRVFEPLLVVGGPLAGSLGQLIGVGPGRGVALAFVIAGLCLVVVAVAGYAHPRVRRVEDELPDAVSDRNVDDAPAEFKELVHEAAR
jgi:DHA3 family macrolide efflux protein-like MFS transporter